MNVSRIHNPLPAGVPQVQPKSAGSPVEKPFAEHLAKNAAPTASSSPDEQQGLLTQEEKEFFEQLYPASAEAVRSYSPYSREGVREAVRLGSLVDRKG
jgi:hypothetical protein